MISGASLNWCPPNFVRVGNFGLQRLLALLRVTWYGENFAFAKLFVRREHENCPATHGIVRQPDAAVWLVPCWEPAHFLCSIGLALKKFCAEPDLALIMLKSCDA